MTAPAEAPVLEARNLYRFFHAGEEETLALCGVSLTVEPGTTVAVLGPSGSGKSTLIGCLAGLDEPAGGTVFVCGERVSHRPETERARIRARRIGVLPQTGNLLQHLDVRGNVRVAQLACGTAAPRHLADELVEEVGRAARRTSCIIEAHARVAVIGSSGSGPVQFAAVKGFQAIVGDTKQTTGAGVVLGLPPDYRSTFAQQIRTLTGADTGVLLAQQTAANLWARPGDTIRIERAGRPAVSVVVAGVVDLPLADTLFQKV